MITVILGTRPEIIKMSPVIRSLKKKRRKFEVIHTGQHYSINMDRVFFEDLKLPQPDHSLDVGTKTSKQGHQTGLMLEGIEKILIKSKSKVVLVQGDTNTVLAGALAACKLHIKVGHIEAGLRSYDRFMPEEHNRVMTDHISDYLFCPTKEAAQNCKKEGIGSDLIHITGNTIVDAVDQNLKISEERKNVLDDLDLEINGYILMTAHRQENVDDQKRFTNIFEAVKSIDYPIIYPIHPRAKKMAKKFGLLKKIPKHLHLVEPVGYLDFLQLESNAKLVLTDSGGLQEEACILGVPCLTLRENTERPETIKVGANKLVGWKIEEIIKSVNEELSNTKKKKFKNPFGDGKAGEKIIQIIC